MIMSLCVFGNKHVFILCLIHVFSPIKIYVCVSTFFLILPKVAWKIHLYDAPQPQAAARRNAKLPKTTFRPDPKDISLDFGSIKKGGASPA